MEDILAVVFLFSIVAGGYFLIRFMIRAIFGGETTGYKKKLAISLGVALISFMIFSVIGMLDYEDDEEDLKADAQRKLEELLDANFPAK